MIKVYIASPYTIGDTALNVKFQIRAGDILMNNGFAPFIPLLSHFQHMIYPRRYEDWLDFDLEWVQVCDCVLRLGGDSVGADGEVEYANTIGKKVFYSIDELKEFYGTQRRITKKS